MTRVLGTSYRSAELTGDGYAVGGDAASNERGDAMLNWVVTLLIIGLIAALLGFGGIAGLSIEIAKTIFFIALILFVVSLLFGALWGGGRRAL